MHLYEPTESPSDGRAFSRRTQEVYYKLRRGLFTNGVMADLQAKKDVTAWEEKKVYQGIFGKMHGTFSKNTTTTRQGRFIHLPIANSSTTADNTTMQSQRKSVQSISKTISHTSKIRA